MPEHAGGDEMDAEFDAFYAKHYGALRAYLRRRGAKHSAEDIIQEAMIRTWIWRRRTPGEPEDSVRRYLYTCATTQLIDLWRRNGRSIPWANFDDLVAEDAESPVGAAERSEERRALVIALRRLPPADRALLIDAEVNEVPTEDLVERYASTANALRVRRWRLRQGLRSSLNPIRDPGPFLLLPGHELARRPHALSRWMRHEHTTGVTAAAHTAAVLVATVSLVAGPFNGPLGPVPPAYADDAVVAPSPAPERRRHATPAPSAIRPVATATSPTTTPAARLTPGPTPTPSSSGAASNDVVEGCVAGVVCTGSGETPPPPGAKDVAYVVIPGVGGEPNRYLYVVPAAAEVCDYWAETPVSGCTEGTPSPSPSPTS